jgi:hypothetical protein
MFPQGHSTLCPATNLASILAFDWNNLRRRFCLGLQAPPKNKKLPKAKPPGAKHLAPIVAGN